MKNKFLLLFLLFIVNLTPYGVAAADESDPCMGDDPVSPALIIYYNEFNQAQIANHVDKNNNAQTKLHPLNDSLDVYYSEFQK